MADTILEIIEQSPLTLEIVKEIKTLEIVQSPSITLEISASGTQGVRGEQGIQGEKGDKGDQGDPASNIVTSVNTKIGDVVLDSDDVGAVAKDQSTPQTMIGKFNLPQVATDLVELKNTYVPTGLEPIGTTFYNSEIGAMEYVIDQYGNITLGHELFDILHNASGRILVNGDVISIVGATGNKQSMDLTDATIGQLATACKGMVTVPSINNNQPGRVTTKGPVRGLNTLSYTEGMPVYVDPLNPGKLTQTPPNSPNYFIHIGIVLVAHTTQGVIDVDIRISPKLTSLSDVNGTPLDTTGQIMVYDHVTKTHDFTENINNYFKTIYTDGTIGGDGKTLTPLSVKESLGIAKTLSYNPDGTLNVVTSANGTKTMVYNPDGTLASVIGTGIYKTKTFTYAGGLLTDIGVI